MKLSRRKGTEVEVKVDEEGLRLSGIRLRGMERWSEDSTRTPP
jgi:hypothetical protein